MDDSKKSCRFVWQSNLYDISLNVNHKEGKISITALPYQLETSLGKFVTAGTVTGTGSSSSTTSDPDHYRTEQIPTSTRGTPLTLAFHSNNCQTGKIIGNRVVENVRKGICHPCILLKVESAIKTFSSIYLIHLLAGGLKLAGQFRPDQNIFKGEDAEYDILNEQLISFICDDRIYLVRFRDPRKQGEICVCSLPDDLVGSSSKSLRNGYKLLAYHPVLLSHTPSTDVFCDTLWLFTTKNAGQEARTHWDLQSSDKTVAVLVSLSQDHACKTKLLDGTDFLPHIYGGLVTCLRISSIQQSSNQNHSDKGQSNDHFESQVMALTSRGQLLCFENGDLRHCISVNGTSETDCAIMTFENCKGDSCIIIHNSNHRAIVIDAETFKESHTFSDVSSVYVGDFSSSGGDQVLLVSDTKVNSSPTQWDSFIVTDFSGCNVRFAESGVTPEEALTDDSFHAALQALEGRLQASITYACGVQREFENKQQLVEKSFETLRQLSLGREGSYSSQPGLMPLLGDVDAKRDSSLPTSRDHPTLRTLDVWQNVFDDFWVIGILLSNTSKRHLACLKVSIVPQEAGQPLNSSSFFLPTNHNTMSQVPSVSDDNFAPKHKSRKVESDQRQSGLVSEGSLTPGETALVLVKTPLPAFFLGNTVVVNLMCSWVELSEGVGLSIEGETMKAEGCADQHAVTSCAAIGSAKLTAQEVLSGSLRIQPDETVTPNGLLVMDVVQTHYPLTLHAAFSDLRQVPALFTGLHFSRVDAAHCWVPPTGVAGLNHARLEVLPQTQPRQLNVSVYCRDESQLFLLVHMLYEAVPDDVTILPRDADDVTALTTSVLNSMTAETDFVRKNTKTLLQQRSESHTASGQERVETPEGTLHMIRKDFQEKQKQLSATKDLALDSEKLEKFQKCLHRMQKQTNDNVEALCARVGKAFIS